MEEGTTKKVIHIRIRGIFALLFIALGLFLSVRGFVIQHNLAQILTEIHPDSLSYGQYIQADITGFLGSFSTFPGEQNKFYPYCNEEFPSGQHTYLVAFPPENDFYFSLYVPASYTKETKQFFLSENHTPYSVTGKVIRLKKPLPYEYFSEFLHLTDMQEIHSLTSPDYAVILVDLEQEKRVLPSGICILLTGLLLSLFSFSTYNMQILPKHRNPLA